MIREHVACGLLVRIAAVVSIASVVPLASAAWQSTPPSNPAPPPPPAAPAPPAVPEGPDPEPDPAAKPKKPPMAAPPSGATPGARPDAPAPPAPPPPKRIDVPPAPTGNLERLDAADREALDARIGWALPLPTGVTPFADGAPVFPGKVVVIQSFTSRTGMQAVRSTEQALAQMLKDPDLVVVALHTPDGAADAQKRVSASTMSAILAVDGSGAWCDALGVWKKPVNIVVDRAGTVRAAGLNRKGLVDAVKEALADRNPPKPSLQPAATAATDAAPAEPKSEWPPYANAIDPKNARDLRGKSAPAMNVAQWLNGPPRLDGRLVVVDFFASWCGPCMKAVPHMNDMAIRHEQDLVVVGISDEQAGTLRTGLGRAGYPVNSFRYPIGVDPNARMKKGFGVTAIPHVAVVSSDGIVRWQGHPVQLNEAAVGALIAANRSAGLRGGTQSASKAKSAATPKRGWTTAG